MSRKPSLQSDCQHPVCLFALEGTSCVSDLRGAAEKIFKKTGTPNRRCVILKIVKGGDTTHVPKSHLTDQAHLVSESLTVLFT